MSRLLTLNNFRKSFGQRTLFDIEELSVETGTAYVLTGQNGTGKTTMLRVLAGLDQGHADQIEFLGSRGTLNPYPAEMRRHIAYVHQHPIMFSTNLEKNIAYGLVVRGVSRKEISARVEEAIEWAGVAYLRGTPMATLSGGEKQRIALARARILNPKLMLLDEPTASLDGFAREQVVALIASLAKSGASVITATHDKGVIHAGKTHRWKLREGKLVDDLASLT